MPGSGVVSNKDWNVLDPRELARSLSDVDSYTLASALSLLVKSGVLRQVYVVVTPSGSLADGEYDDPRQIPERIPDRFNHYFDTLEAEIIPVLRPAGK